MSDVNKVILVGRLGNDPELKKTEQGTAVVHFQMATSQGHGERRETQWHHVTVFGPQAERCAQYLEKGRLCCVEGRVAYRKREQGESTRYYTNIIASSVAFLSHRRASGQSAAA